MPVLRASDKDFAKKLKSFVGTGEAAVEIRQTVATIIDDIKVRGDVGVLYHTARFDHAKLSIRQLRISVEQLQKAADNLAPEKRKAFTEAIKCIEDFHRRTLPLTFTLPANLYKYLLLLSFEFSSVLVDIYFLNIGSLFSS